MFSKTWPFRKITAVPFFLTLLGLHLVWCLFAVGILASPDPEIKMFLARYKYVVLTWMAPSTFLFIISLFRPQIWKRHPLLLKALYVLPFFLCVSSFLPQTKELFVHSFELISVFDGHTVRWVDGPLFKIHFAFSALLMISGYLVMLGVILRDPLERKQQAFTMLLGVTALVLVDITTVSFDLPIRWLNHGALLCLPLLLSYAYCVFRFDLINILPLAKKNLFEQLPAPVYVIENSGRIVAMNSFAKNNIPIENIQSFLQAFLNRSFDFSSTEDNIITIKNSAEQKYQVKVNALKNRYSHVIGYTLVLVDITAMQEANERLSELILLKDKVFSVLAHDVSSNLAGIELLTEVTGVHIKSNSLDLVETNMEQLKSGIRSARSVLFSLLNWVKKEPSESKEKFQLAEVVMSAIEDSKSLSQPKEIKWNIEVNNISDVWVYHDKEMLRSTIRNLLSNALKVSPQHGEIKIACSQSNTQWTLMVCDQGPGMKPDNIDRLNGGKLPLKLEDQASAGFGIGLSVVQEFLRKNRGFMTAKNLNPGLQITLCLDKTYFK